MFADKEEIEEDCGIDDFVEKINSSKHLKYTYSVEGTKGFFSAVLILDKHTNYSHKTRVEIVENKLKSVYTNIHCKILIIDDNFTKKTKERKEHGNKGKKRPRNKNTEYK